MEQGGGVKEEEQGGRVRGARGRGRGGARRVRSGVRRKGKEEG